MKPISAWILVERLESEEKTESGIYIPSAAKEGQKISRNKVLKISEDIIQEYKKEGREIPYKEGDIVLTHVQVGIQYIPYSKEKNIMFLKTEAVMGVE
jgi:co-chaperonin GroES (HSP10)